VAYGSTTSGRALRQLLENELREKRVCVDSYIKFLQDATGSQLIRNVTGSDKPRGVIILSTPSECRFWLFFYTSTFKNNPL